MRLGEIWQVIP